ncbi:MAG: phosphoglycerate kinase [Candidatus Saccharibacteria bacterium]
MGFFKQTIRDVPLEGQTVLLRADYNVPLDKNGKIDDDFRIRASLPTVEKLLSDGCKVVVISHLGRPEGRDASMSLEPAAQRLAELLKLDVRFVDDCIGDKVKMAIKRAPSRSVVVLENLRFYKEEEANDQVFAKRLAADSGARYFVQDGFGVVHRAHASTAAITLELPSVAGLLLEREYISITEAMKAPKRPFVAVMGGAKVSDKIGVIDALVEVADRIIISGAMANTFLAYKGIDMGASRIEADQTETLDRIYAAAGAKVGNDHEDEFLVLPTDVAVASKIDASEPRRIVSVHEVGQNDLALDVGDETIAAISSIIADAQTVIWNGTLGVAELPHFSYGSAQLAKGLAENPHVTSIIGGGDTADFVLKWDSKKGGSFSHVSTGGGASLELMAGEKLPGIECLLDAHR